MFDALMALDHRLGHGAFNEAVAHVRQGGVPVQTGLRLHLDDTVLQQLLLVLVQTQQVRQLRVPLDELGGAEAGGYAQLVGVVLDKVDHGVDAAVDGGALVAEIVYPRQGLVLCHGDGLVDKLGHALALGGHDGHHRDAQLPAQAADVHGAAVGAHLVHHVQGQHRRYAQLQQLQGEVEVPLDICGVDNVYYTFGPVVEDEVSGDYLLLGVGPQGIDAGQVHHAAIFLTPHLAHLLVHSDAGEIAHVLVGAGEGVEEGGLAAVLIAHQSKDHQPFTSGSISIFCASSMRRVSS